MAITPQFIEVPFAWSARLAGTPAAVARNQAAPAGVLGTTLIGVASSQGAMVDAIYAIPIGTVTDTTVRLWLKRPTDAVPLFLMEVAIAALTASDTAAIARTAFVLPDILTPSGSKGLRLGANCELHASLGVVQTPGVHVIALGGHYGTGYGGTGGGTP